MSVTRFDRENFSLVEEASHYQLDAEVARRIADALFSRDGQTRGSVGFFNPSVVVDPTGQTITEPNKFSGLTDRHAESRISFSADLSSDVNATFGRHMQAVLLERERRNRMGPARSIAWSAAIMGLPATSIVGLNEAVALTPQTLFMSTVIGAAGLWFGWGEVKRQRRRNVVRPWSAMYERKLAAAEKIAMSLNLPPVVDTYN